MAKKYYAVKRGRKSGIYQTWDECKLQTLGFSNAQYKSFQTLEDAKEFLKSGQEEQMVVDEGTLIAYVDGSYDHTKKEFSYGMVLIFHGEESYYGKKYGDPKLVSMRNVAGEIKGAETAMQYAAKYHISKLAIYYDYEGIQKWCTGEWRTNKEGTRAYKEFYEQMKSKIQVKFVKVKGHSNDRYNDMADMLAKSALDLGDGSFVSIGNEQWKKCLQKN